MRQPRLRIARVPRIALAGVFAIVGSGIAVFGQQQDSTDRFRFRTAVELVNVTATVTDRGGRFVSGLRKEDFAIFEDGQPQSITHFSNERVPVSLGIVLDTSGSMAGEKMTAAQNALDRFLFDLLGPDDEVFLYVFDEDPDLVAEWTTDRRTVSRALSGIRPRGGTAMYDAVAEAVPLAQSGTRRKKALVVISDGNDTSSRIDAGSLKQLIRETEVLVYAIGIDGSSETNTGVGIPRQPRLPIPLPFPIPGRRNPFPQPPSRPPSGGGGYSRHGGDRVNVGALREITDDSGGRTEIIRSARDLEPATASIADELSKQYYLGYPAGGEKDGRWHTIRVEVRDQVHRVRARRGYIRS